MKAGKNKKQKTKRDQKQSGAKVLNKVDKPKVTVNLHSQTQEPMTVTVGASATLRVGDHEFLRPEIVIHNIDPKKDIDAQISEATKAIDKGWAEILRQILKKATEFKA